MKGWTPPSEQQEAPPQQTNIKEEICLEQTKRKVKIASLERGDFVLQKKLKSLMYVDRSLRRYPRKDNLIDELNFRNCMSFKRKTTSKLFVGIKDKGRKFIIHAEYFDANTIFSDPFIQNTKHKSNIINDMSKQMKKAL